MMPASIPQNAVATLAHLGVKSAHRPHAAAVRELACAALSMLRSATVAFDLNRSNIRYSSLAKSRENAVWRDSPRLASRPAQLENVVDVVRRFP